MYVDKPLSGIKAVQTLSRLNRAHPKKHDVFVLDFLNDTDTIQAAFADYYRTTILSEETDPNKLHDLKAELDGYQVYDAEQVDELRRALSRRRRPRQARPDPRRLRRHLQRADLDEDGQVDFKGKAKAFVRTYGFLASILPVHERRLGEALDLPELPGPEAAGAEGGGPLEGHPRSHRHGQLPRREAGRHEDPAARRGRRDRARPDSGGGHKPEPELDRLSNILKTFNDQFGNIDWTDADRVQRLITEEIPAKVAADEAYQNARKNNSDKQNARIEHDKALARDDRPAQGRHRALQAVQRQRVLPSGCSKTVFALTYQPPESGRGHGYFKVDWASGEHARGAFKRRMRTSHVGEDHGRQALDGQRTVRDAKAIDL